MKKVLLPIIVIVLALGVTVSLVKSRKTPQPHETPHLGPLVEVKELVETSHSVIVRGTGTVQAAREVTITPQVKGRVVEVSPRMVAGGVFAKDELLFAIEDVDYRLAIDLARSSLAQAELELLRNQNLAEVARQEWQALNQDATIKPNPLVVYEPQLKSAMAKRDAAIANVKQAEINLQRTKFVAPFNCYVRSEQVETGQFLNAGAPVATVAGTDVFEIVVPLSLDQLAWLQVPRNGLSEVGSKARVALRTGGQEFQWFGTIARALGEIDPRNRMANVVVRVEDPFAGVESDKTPLNALRPGMFVEVKLQGQEISNVFAIPRGALHDNDTVWIVDADNKLQIHEVDIVRRELDEVLVRSGLQTGDRLILTNLSSAAKGMLLRPQLQEVK